LAESSCSLESRFRFADLLMRFGPQRTTFRLVGDLDCDSPAENRTCAQSGAGCPSQSKLRRLTLRGNGGRRCLHFPDRTQRSCGTPAFRAELESCFHSGRSCRLRRSSVNSSRLKAGHQQRFGAGLTVWWSGKPGRSLIPALPKYQSTRAIPLRIHDSSQPARPLEKALQLNPTRSTCIADAHTTPATPVSSVGDAGAGTAEQACAVKKLGLQPVLTCAGSVPRFQCAE
jgi:hypothetical protein